MWGASEVCPKRTSLILAKELVRIGMLLIFVSKPRLEHADRRVHTYMVLFLLSICMTDEASADLIPSTQLPP